MITPAELAVVPLFSGLTTEQLAFVADSVEDIRLMPGEFAGREGDDRALFIVLEGRLELTKVVNGVERVVGTRLPGTFFGEVPMMLSTQLPASPGAAEPSRVLKLSDSVFFRLAAMAPEVAATVGRYAMKRMESLRELAAEPAAADMTLVGRSGDPRVHRIRTFLTRNRVSIETVEGTDGADGDVPVVALPDGRRLADPSLREIARAGGLSVAPEHDGYDLVIVGGGPTGLTAAVNGAAEGLRTLVVERFAPGGQAGTSTRIENYTGFPYGVSGDELAAKALRQAQRLGAEIVVTRTVESLDPASRTVTLDGGTRLDAQVVLLASGVEWRRLPVEGMDRFVGNGVYYGAARSDAAHAHARDVVIVGAGNSAGQAALFFSRHARSVTLLVRGESLEASMSTYLIEQLAANPAITVDTRREVIAVHGDEELAALDVLDRRTGQSARRDAQVLFVMIGADAETGWLPAAIVRDGNGYIVTGADAQATGSWALARAPFALETTAPGVFAAGDVRSGSVKRVAAGVGEGGMAVAFVHQYLALATAAASD